MNFNPASVVAAAAAAAHQHPTAHHHHHHHPYLSHHQPLQPLQQHHSQQQQQQQQQSQPQQQLLIPLPGGAGAGSIPAGGGGGGGDTSPKIMEWTNDDALELIEQYRCHTELWNRADPKYKDKLCRFRAWSEIAERFGCSKAEVERKMNVLLTQYRREKHKMFVKIYQGIQPNPSKWYAFKRFDFMEAGGGSLSASGGGVSGVNTSGGSNLVPNPVSSSAAAAAHNGLNGLAAAAVAAAAYESGTIAAAGNGGAPGVGGGGGSGSQPAMQHRRIKTKEMKYFGTMGLNIPMLIASSQTLDSWNTAGQYSPPISGSGGGGSDRGGSGPPPQQLRVPLPMSYHGVGGGGLGGGGGGSSSSDFQQSPLKTMDTSDNEDNNNTKEDVAAAAALGQLAAKVERRSPASGGPGSGPGGGGSVIGGGGGGSSSREANDQPSDPLRSERTLSEAGSSPIPNTNMHEAHKNHLLNSPAGPGRAATPRQAHEQLHHHPHTHHLQQQQQQQQQHVTQQLHAHGHDELDIKQELVDYFHGQATGVAPPPPPESHRSYSSAGEESRLQLVDMAQDLRVAQAKANFGSFVLPPQNSGDASQTPAVVMPLNMRKLTNASSAAAAAGHMLMSSLLGSRESMSDGEEPDPDNDEATESAASPGHIKSSVSAQAAVAASAFYAESLNRDDCDFIGSNVSLKLRTMDRTQRIIAEKLISEVLYYGQFNELERSARIQPK
ncbi:hypothetical protein KR059_011872 [Drosophila kikkawai]|nr:hypothetical protein KR059_011872 [Drosophila kikkawai]